MEVTVMLPHCSNVQVYPTDPPGPPLTGGVRVTVGGAVGDGSVTVTTDPPQAIPPVFTGQSSPTFDATPLKTIHMHYFATPGRPQVVEVTVAPPPPPPPPSAGG